MYTEFDYRDEQTRLEEKFATFFGEFSSEVRKRLLSKNLVKPESIYDVFYPSFKDELLSKNVKTINTDLDEFSETIRNLQIAKIVPKIFSLEEQSEDFRNSMVHRNKLQESVEKMVDVSLEKRKDLLSKNVSVDSDLLERSFSFRRDSVAHNRIDVSEELIESKIQDQFRQGNVSKIVEKDSVLEEQSVDFRDNNISKNVGSVNNLDKSSDAYRKENVSHNIQKMVDLEKISSQHRADDLSKNTEKNIDVEEVNAPFRNQNLSKNVGADRDLEKDSSGFRNDDVSKNKIQNTVDLEEVSANFRKEDLSKNTSKTSDLDSASSSYRDTNLSNNTPKEQDVEGTSAIYRDNNLSNNVAKESDLESASGVYRKEDLSNNAPKETNLEKDSVVYRGDDLSLNVAKSTNIETISEDYRNDDLSLNVPKGTSLENDSIPYRESDLANNVPIETDLEINSIPYREDDLSLNVSKGTDLENDSIPYREDDLSLNTPIQTDLENDSVPYREDDLANNVPIETDLENDSVPYREDDLANNVPISTNLETDSVPFREDDLANNVPIETNLETDSVPFREGDLANNVPIETDLEIDSVTFREGDLANNVPIETDLETDSVPFREGDLANNVPIETDIETDSVPFREGDLANNVDMGYTIDRHVDMFGNLSSAQAEKEGDISKNIRSQASVDGFYDKYGNKTTASATRENNLSKNQGGGMLGFNVMAFGTSQYIGVSGVWAQGLLFRNLLLLRNKKGGFFYSGEDTNIDKFVNVTTGTKYTADEAREENVNRPYRQIFDYSPDFKYNKRLLDDTLKVPSKEKIYNKGSLPITPSDEINSNMSLASFGNYVFTKGMGITSPIERNLTVAFQDTVDGMYYTQSMFGIDGRDLDNGSIGKRRIVDYSLNNQLDFSSNLKTEITFGESDFSQNVNSLIREFLKSINFYSLDDNGELQDPIRQASNATKIASQIISLQTAEVPGYDTIRDLVLYYKLFDVNRLNSLIRKRVSVTAPGQNYFKEDVEKMYDTQYGLESNTSIAFKKFVGNPTEDDGFAITRKKGVKNVIKRISQDSSIQFSQNYKDIQGPSSSSRGESAIPKIFIIGKKTDGSIKQAMQKYTIKNPYAPEGAGRLIFYLKNYAIPIDKGSIMYFPPYIQSFQNSDSANWNSVNFLGRPEAVYTYNNSSRSGTITFYVLTDFAERVTIGRYQSGSMKKIIKEFDQSFLGTSSINSLIGQEIESQIDEKIKKIRGIEKQRAEGNGIASGAIQKNEENSTDTQNNEKIDQAIGSSSSNNTNDEQSSERDNLYQEKLLLEKALFELEAESVVNFDESGIGGRNVYNFGNNNYERVGDEIISVVGATEDRIDEMIKNLSFQPSYFSGSLVDFKKKMEFLSKLTRPARNDKFPSSSSIGFTKKEITEGFSFTKPPVCHLRLGDWYDHDVIIDSVSYDYSDAPWTVGSSKVQPMWVSVSIQFNIIGPAGIEGGVPLTASDEEGYYGTSSKI